MEGILPIIILIIIGNIYRGVMKAKAKAPRKERPDAPTTPAEEIKNAIFEQIGGALGQTNSARPSGTPVVPTPNLDWAMSSPHPEKTGGPGTLSGSIPIQNSPREEMESRLEKATLSEGFSREDDEGCIGGSIEHAKEEGQARPRKATEAALPPIATPSAVSTVSAAQLRQAVIMSEILRAPVTLRRRASAR